MWGEPVVYVWLHVWSACVCVCACVCACVCVSVSMEMGQWRKSGTLLVHSDQTQMGKAGQEEPVTIKRKKDNKMIKPRINKRR